MLRRASRFDLTIDKGGNSTTLVPTTAMRPDVTAKRWSRGTWECAEFDSTNFEELVVKRKYDEVVEKIDAGIWVKTCVWLIDRLSHYIALGSTFIPCPKSYNQTRLGLEFQTKRNPYTERILIAKENIKLPPCSRPGHRHRSISNLHAFLRSHRQTSCCGHRQTLILVIGTKTSPPLDLVTFSCFPYRQPPSSATSM